MAALASVSRCSSLHISAPRLPVFVPQAMRAVQTRTKTTQKPDRKIAQNHKSGKGSYEGGQVAQPKKEKKLGAFRPLSASTLTNPIFKSDQRSELELPAFSNKELGKPTAVGTALEFDLPQNHPFRIFGIPKSMLLEFRLLSKPCSVVRDVTLSAIETMQSAGEKPSSDTRVVLTGAPGCGKSFVLLQSMSHCIQNQWLVMYIPRALNLVNSTTTYAYDMRTQTYLQPAFAFQTLQRFQTVNADALAALTTQGEVELEKRAPLVAGTPLTELISVGLKDQTIAPSVLEAVLTELGKQTTHPVLLAIDDFQALYCTSMYRDTQFSRIKSYHLSMPRLLLEYASGKKTFARGAVLGALSTSHTGFLAPVELRDALGLTHGAPAGPYVKRNAAYVEYARGLRTLPVPDRLSVDEAAALFEVWKEDKAFLGEAPDEMFLAKYTESAGNARNFVGKGLLASLGY